MLCVQCSYLEEAAALFRSNVNPVLVAVSAAELQAIHLIPLHPAKHEKERQASFKITLSCI